MGTVGFRATHDRASNEDEYGPNLSVNDATLRMYDSEFEGSQGALLKKRILAAAAAVDLNPGLIASVLLAETKVKYYTQTSDTVEGWVIGVDDYAERIREIERKVPAARRLNPVAFIDHTNEQKRVVENIPVFRAEDAVLASAVYLKHGEIRVRESIRAFGGDFDLLPVEYRFALTRYAMNAGPGAARDRAAQMLGLIKHRNKHKRVYYTEGGKVRDMLSFSPGPMKHGFEQFHRHFPGRAATVHTAQAIHLSQAIFGVNPFKLDDSLIFVRL